MTNQSACRSNRSNYPGSYADRSVSKQGRVSQGYPAHRTGSYAIRTAPNTAERESCDCEHRNSNAEICVSSNEFPVGMTYTPMQQWGNLYCPSKALEQGTLFADLDKPFLGRRGTR